MAMTHEEVRAQISAGETAPEAEGHLAKCKGCRAWVQALEKVRAFAPELGAPPAPIGLADRAIAAARAAAPTSAAAVASLDAARAARAATAPPWYRRVGGRLAVAAVVAGAVAAAAIVVPRDDAGAVLVAAATKTQDAQTARVEFRGSMTATIALDADKIRRMIPELPGFRGFPEGFEPPEAPEAPAGPDLDALREQARAQYEQCKASGAPSGACEAILEGLNAAREGIAEGVRSARAAFADAMEAARDAQKEFFRIARSSLEDAREMLREARAAILAAIPEKIEVEMQMRGTGQAVFPDRVHLRGRMTVDSTLPLPLGGPFELIVDGDHAYLKTPFSDDWIRMPASQSPFSLPFKPGKILDDMREVPGAVEDLGRETLGGEQVRHYRVRHAEVGGEVGPSRGRRDLEASLDLWIGAEDEILRKAEMGAEGGGEAGPAAMRFAAEGSFRLHDFGADASVKPPKGEDVIEDAEDVFSTGVFDLGIGDAGLSLSMHVGTTPGFAARASGSVSAG